MPHTVKNFLFEREVKCKSRLGVEFIQASDIAFLVDQGSAVFKNFTLNFKKPLGVYDSLLLGLL